MSIKKKNKISKKKISNFKKKKKALIPKNIYYKELNLYKNPKNNLKLFFKLFQLQPIAFNLTFYANNASHHQSNNPFQVLFDLILASVGNLDHAQFRLDSLTIDNMYGNIEVLQNSLITHYSAELLSQVYKIIGSLEVLGNPVKLIDGIGTGVINFFYEPAKGLTQSPAEFGKGLAKGSMALVKGTVGSIFSAASKITGAASKGIEMLSIDDENDDLDGDPEGQEKEKKS